MPDDHINQAHGHRQTWLVGLLLVVGVILAYQPVWHAGFIWDDDVYVVNNRLLTAPDGLERIWFSSESPSQYFPLTYTVLRLERSLWGLNPAGYHWVNLLLHAANALLVWRVLQRLKVPGAWLAAALFAFHPVQVETVAWVSELKNILSLFFSLLALLAWIKFINEDRTSSWRFYALGLLCYALALSGKTTACTLPAALVLILWLEKKPLPARRWLQILPFLVLGAGMGLLSIWWERHHQNTFGEIFAIGPLQRLLIASRAVWFYAGKLIWPVDLSFSYERWKIDPADAPAWVWPAAGAMLVLVICLTRRFFGRSVEVAGLYFVATLSPMLGFVMEYTFKYSFVADHYQYAAGIGPLALAAAGLNKALGCFERRTPLLKPAVWAAVLLTLATLTWRQSRTYLDSETLWRTTMARNPGSTMARNNLSRALLAKGHADEAVLLCQTVLATHPNDVTAQFNLGDGLLQKGRLDEAIAHFQKALELQPAMSGIPYSIGEAYLKKGQMDAAIRYFQRAIQLQPDYPAAFCNLGYALLQEGRRGEAMAAYNKALELDPRYALAHNDLGNILLQLGRTEEAMNHFRQAAEILPDFAEARFNMAEVFLARGRLDDAVSQYRKALEIRPDLADAHYKLGNIFAQQGREAEAVSHYESALKTRPDLARACNNLAWLLAASPDPSLRNGPRAIELAQRADQLARGKNPVFLGTLAAAYAETGQFGQAVKTIERALPLAANDAALTRALENQKALAKGGRPFRERPRR